MFRRLCSTAFALFLIATPILAQDAKPAAAPAAKPSLKGTWVGFANTQNGNQPVTFVFDSTADGWSGGAYSAQMGRDTLYFTSVKVKGDTVNFAMDIQGTAISFSGVRSGNTYSSDIWMNGTSAGTLRIAKAGTAEAANLLTPPEELLSLLANWLAGQFVS